MATWQDVIGYVRANYKVAEEGQGRMKLIFETGNLRTQVVLLWRQTLGDGGEEWLQIESPFGDINAVNMPAAVRAVGQTVCGGIASFGDFVTIRHSLPLDNLNINEFERPLALVTNTADQFEQMFTGGDRL